MRSTNKFGKRQLSMSSLIENELEQRAAFIKAQETILDASLLEEVIAEQVQETCVTIANAGQLSIPEATKLTTLLPSGPWTKAQVKQMSTCISKRSASPGQ